MLGIFALIVKHWRLILPLVVLIFILGISYLAYYYKTQYEIQKSDKENVIKLKSKAFKQIDYYRSKNNQLVAVNEKLELSNKTVQDLVNNQDMAWLKEIKGLKKDFRNLEQITQITALAYDSVKALINKHKIYITPKGDTLTAFSASYQDQYAKLGCTQVSQDSAVFTYGITVPLQGAILFTKKWFLGHKHYQSQLTSPNKHVTIVQLEQISVTRKK